ncbi:MAG TPA: SagB family peptide dehydrogenase [Candidatus Acidoferrales bacterium]|nr:SagB family peptide dehydrogenase [Candidatus Acidoferrales bacterium]
MSLALRRYHEATKHSRLSVRLARPLDWANKPLPFKVYSGLDGIPPPEDVGRLCLLSNGVLRWRQLSGGGAYGFRAAACTGALYHVELYLATAERPDLPAGLYHYGAHDHQLRLLRPGDQRGVLLQASGGYRPIAQAPQVFILTSTIWRNAWKYRARAYRHAYWDSGVILANLLALTPAQVVMGFADAEVNRLVGADGEREVAVALVAVGEEAPPPLEAARLDELDLPTQPLSARPVRYPEIEAAHAASSLASGADAAAWRGVAAPGAWEPPGGEVEAVIRRRRSTREFDGSAITRAQLEDTLATAMAPIPGDSFPPGLVEPFLIVNAVEGLERGAYGSGLEVIRPGDFRRAAGELALGQELGRDAAANVYFLSDLDRIFEQFGERGYRVAQMAGGIAGGRFELAATAAGLGATGLTFFDDKVTRFFEPAAAGRQVMYLAAIGQTSHLQA